MKFTKIALASASLLIVGLAAAPSYATAPDKKIALKDKTETRLSVPEPPEGLPPLPPISDAELERVAALKTKFMENNSAKHSELQSLHRQMEMLMTKPTIDRAQAMQLQSRINAVHADLANSKLNFDLDMLDGMPADAKERMRKHRLMDAAFGPSHRAGLGGSPPPGFGPPRTCAPPPGFGPPPPFGPPPFGAIPGFHHGKGPMPGGGPGGSPPAPPPPPPGGSTHAPPPPPPGSPEVKHETRKPAMRYQLT